MAFDGSDVGLTTSAEAIDAVTGLADGSLLLSTRRSGSVPLGSGSLSFAAEDLLRFAPTSLGANTAGSWSLWADLSDVGLNSSNENLTAVARPGQWTPDGVYAMFPRLAERKGNLGTQLSGGEQQMLAVARALVVNPRLLLLDEPLEGLAPIIVEELLRAIRRITREEGLSAIIVEQHPQAILAISDQAVVLDRGTIAHAGTARELREDPALVDRLLGVAR